MAVVTLRAFPHLRLQRGTRIGLLAILAGVALGMAALVVPESGGQVAGRTEVAAAEPSALARQNAERADAILAEPWPTVEPSTASSDTLISVPAPVVLPFGAPDGTDSASDFREASQTYITDEAAAADIVQAAADRTRSFVPRPRATGYEAQFIHALGLTARATYGTGMIPPSVTIAQAILDTGWGRSQLAATYRNYFGIKASGRPGSGPFVNLPTIEYYDGKPVWVDAPFRVYRSLAESVADHHRFLIENSRYRTTLQYGHNPALFARGLQQAGFATDPNYASKLVSIMDRYQLYVYDVRYETQSRLP